MSKRGENIHKRKDGRWEGRYIKKRKTDGTIHYGSVYGKTYREVKEKLYTVISEKKQPVFVPKEERNFEDVLNLWMDNNRIRLKKATVTKYQNLIDTHIMPELGKVKLSKIDATQINAFLMHKLENGRLDGKGGLSPSYVRSMMLVIHAVVKFAVDEQMMETLKTPICKPVLEKKEISILNTENRKKLEDYLKTELDLTKTGILLSLYMGLRIGEICALSWNDVDLENRIVHVRHTVARVKNTEETGKSTMLIIDTPKTKASVRDIPITQNILPILKTLFETSTSEYVISDTENFVNPRTFEYRYHKILDKCGIESVNYHILRHTFASRCIEVGVDVKSLSEILGHANVSVTLNTYVHSSMEQKREQLEKISAISF